MRRPRRRNGRLVRADEVAVGGDFARPLHEGLVLALGFGEDVAHALGFDESGVRALHVLALLVERGLRVRHIVAVLLAFGPRAGCLLPDLLHFLSGGRVRFGFRPRAG
jgi:hypothetical protein